MPMAARPGLRVDLRRERRFQLEGLRVSEPAANFLNAHEWAYGVTEVAHIVSLAIAIGLIAVVDLRLLNQGIVQVAPRRLIRATAIGTLIGFITAITTGFMIFSTDPARYVVHPAMRLKLILLLVALGFNYTIHGQVARGGRSPFVCRGVAVMSLALWISVVFSGIFYAFT
jgi:uncharacterized protein DUF6644